MEKFGWCFIDGVGSFYMCDMLIDLEERIVDDLGIRKRVFKFCVVLYC